VAGLERTPIGKISVAATGKGIISLFFAPLEETNKALQGFTGVPGDAPVDLLNGCLRQLMEYFNGSRKHFDVPLDWECPDPFEARVHRLTVAIPFGQVRTYGDIALELGSRNGARAVGSAQARNPIPLLIPCHRVIGADRNLHGYAAPGGIETKAWLLTLEGHRVTAGKVEIPGTLPQLPLFE
jgi:methylated-DNA-[protein]-cysteine S-methyltransferase